MSQSYKGPVNYNEVADRIREFRTKFPDGSLQQVDLKFIDFAGKSWVVYTAAAYRSPDDERPGIGTAWEPVPGLTPYTKNSEVMVAETSAWGRAMVAALAVDAQKVASADEVANRPKETTASRDWTAELNATSDIEALRQLYNEARTQKAPADVLKAISAKGKSDAKRA